MIKPELCLACVNVTTVQIKLKCIPSFTNQTHIMLPTVSLPDYHDYHEKVISDILHEGDTVYLLNIDTIRTYLHFF